MGLRGISETSVLNALRRVITQKTEEFSSTAVEALGLQVQPHSYRKSGCYSIRGCVDDVEKK